MHIDVYFASVNLACFPFRIKFSTKKDQEAVINFFKNFNDTQDIKENKAELKALSPVIFRIH